jgi:hypothetical protein
LSSATADWNRKNGHQRHAGPDLQSRDPAIGTPGRVRDHHPNRIALRQILSVTSFLLLRSLLSLDAQGIKQRRIVMRKVMKLTVIMFVFAMLAVSPAFGGDQQKDQDRDQDRARDGSCTTGLVETDFNAYLAGDQDRTQDRDQDRDQKKDGSCKVSSLDAESSRLLAANRARTRGGKGDQQRDRGRDRLRDGSCQG